MAKLLSKWQETINRQAIKTIAVVQTMDNKTMALLSVLGVVGMVGFSFADDNITNFVTCDGAVKIYKYGKPITLFLAIVVFIVGIMMAAFEAFSKKYGHALAVILFAVLITGFLWGAGKALDTYGANLVTAICPGGLNAVGQ
jgi:hypothetical protein